MNTTTGIILTPRITDTPRVLMGKGRCTKLRTTNNRSPSSFFFFFFFFFFLAATAVWVVGEMIRVSAPGTDRKLIKEPGNATLYYPQNQQYGGYLQNVIKSFPCSHRCSIARK